MPPSPKPNKIGRTPREFDWLDLPAEGRKGRTPPMPKMWDWSADDRQNWKQLWRLPQAAAWESAQHHEFVARLVILRRLFREEPTAPVSAEMRQLEDRLGLNPKAMMQLRWRIVADEVADRRNIVEPVGESARDRLRALP
jgi:hypothetical protein